MKKEVRIYTDGACKGNPGRGGYGVILACGEIKKELSAGYRHTTNNRMELMAAIAGLEALRRPAKVTLYSDSKYLTDALTKGWIPGWRKRGWQTAARKPVKNQDLWERLDRAIQDHEIAVQWVKGHAGHAQNERCDELANEAAAQPQALLLVDSQG